MKLHVLVDNNTLINKFLYAETGLSFLIEDNEQRILFDVGYSDCFLTNAQKIGFDLKNLDYIVLSHGHLDHTWGLFYLIKYYSEFITQDIALNIPSIVTHPSSFYSKIDDNNFEIGSIVSKVTLSKLFPINTTIDPLWLTKNIVFLGQIPRKNTFEGKKSLSKVVMESELKDDFIIEDSALVYKSKDGLVIITGCSHSGICNIVQYAIDVCADARIIDIIGGFHLLNPSKDLLDSTINFLSSIKPSSLHPCHCTDFKSKVQMSKCLNVEDVGVGLQLEYI